MKYALMTLLLVFSCGIANGYEYSNGSSVSSISTHFDAFLKVFNDVCPDRNDSVAEYDWFKTNSTDSFSYLKKLIEDTTRDAKSRKAALYIYVRIGFSDKDERVNYAYATPELQDWVGKIRNYINHIPCTDVLLVTRTQIPGDPLDPVLLSQFEKLRDEISQSNITLDKTKNINVKTLVDFGDINKLGQMLEISVQKTLEFVENDTIKNLLLKYREGLNRKSVPDFQNYIWLTKLQSKLKNLISFRKNGVFPSNSEKSKDFDAIKKYLNSNITAFNPVDLADLHDSLGEEIVDIIGVLIEALTPGSRKEVLSKFQKVSRKNPGLLAHWIDEFGRNGDLGYLPEISQYLVIKDKDEKTQKLLRDAAEGAFAKLAIKRFFLKTVDKNGDPEKVIPFKENPPKDTADAMTAESWFIWWGQSGESIVRDALQNEPIRDVRGLPRSGAGGFEDPNKDKK